MLLLVGRYPRNLTIFDTLQSRYELPLGSTAEFTCLATANNVNSLEIFYHRTDRNPLGDNVDRPEHDGATIDRRTTFHINGVTVANGGEYECIVRYLTDDGGSVPLGRRNFTIVVTCKFTSNNDIYKTPCISGLKVSLCYIAKNVHIQINSRQLCSLQN